jgi:uncharacterized protein YcbK (DUF882 family)
MAKISEHFEEVEFLCPCCQKLPPDFRDGDGSLTAPYQFFFDQLEDIRRAWQRPMPISSGYRCSKKNVAVGGEPLSVHLFGLAIDMPLRSAREVNDIIELARDIAPSLRKGWKKYLDEGQTFVHFDAGFYIYPRPSVNFLEGVEW